MSVRSLFAGALVAMSTSLSGCAAAPPAAPLAGGIEIVIVDVAEVSAAGALTLSRSDGAERWRLPLNSRAEQTRHLSLPAGLYSLDQEPDVLQIMADPASPAPAAARAGALPRWVVVAPGRVTHVTVRVDEEQIATGTAGAALASFP